MKNNRFINYFLLTPLIGIISFIALYIVAAYLYPGGSNVNKTEKGFNLMTNYWCDLTGDLAKNGQPNLGQFYALIAITILCFSLMVFWFYLPELFKIKNKTSKVIQYSGIISMSITLFLFTSYHDTVINISGFFGVIAVILTLNELKKQGFNKLLGLGLVCFAMGSINYGIYQTQQFLFLLAIFQKLTFVLCLTWFGVINLIIYKQKIMVN
jgi:hypothetical protein